MNERNVFTIFMLCFVISCLHGGIVKRPSPLSVDDKFDTIFFNQGLAGIKQLYTIKEKGLDPKKLQEEIESSLIINRFTDPYLNKQQRLGNAIVNCVRIPFGLGILISGLKVASNLFFHDSVKPISTTFLLGFLGAYYRKAYLPGQIIKKEKEAFDWLNSKNKDLSKRSTYN